MSSIFPPFLPEKQFIRVRPAANVSDVSFFGVKSGGNRANVEQPVGQRDLSSGAQQISRCVRTNPQWGVPLPY